MGSNWKIWSMTLFLVLGLCFEVLKHIPMHPLKLNDGIADSRAVRDGDQYLVRGRSTLSPIAALRAHRLAPHIHGAPTPKLAPKPVLVATAEPSQDKGGEESEFAQATEEKKKKKKKKKKKDAELNQVEEVVAEALPEIQEAPKKTSPFSLPTSDIITVRTTQPIPPAAAAPEQAMTADEWIALLSKSPEQKNLAKFIAAYKGREIKADVYYKVIDALVADARIELKQMGVEALNQTPSVASFLMLADLTKDEALDPTVRQKTDAALTGYETIANLNVLNTILQSSDNSHATVLATQKLDSAIKKYSALGGPTEPPTGQGTGAAYVTYFQGFAPVLENLVQSGDATVVAQASLTLASLRSYLESNANNTAAL